MPETTRLSADDLARYRADYHQCRLTIMPLLDEIEALTRERDEARRVLGLSLDAHAEEVRRSTRMTAEVDRLRALLLAVCRQHPNAVLTDGDTTMTLAHLVRRLEKQSDG
jgi:hypothetical protein